MAKYGILKSAVNNGLESELISVFIAPLTIESKKISLISETMGMVRRGTYSDNQRWEVTCGMRPNNDADMFAQQVVAGFSDSFHIRMPQLMSKKKIVSNIVFSADKAYSGGAPSVGLTGGGGVNLPVGHFIKFSGHDKVYMVTASSYSNGLNIVRLMPKLRKAIVAGEEITYGANVTMRVLYGDNAPTAISYTDGILSRYDSLQFVEAL